ncbi:hypothetical protein K438DRAFT_2024702 [Mycena galopus ATCC 62051]|nr:hypothetical protein K438DRAFT_2024702 [Mycena galopus ATCC 62051]
MTLRVTIGLRAPHVKPTLRILERGTMSGLLYAHAREAGLTVQASSRMGSSEWILLFPASGRIRLERTHAHDLLQYGDKRQLSDRCHVSLLWRCRNVSSPSTLILLSADLPTSDAEMSGSIPQNWKQSWDLLRDTLQGLEEHGMALSAVLQLLHVRIIRDEAGDLDTSSVADLKPHLGTNYVPTPRERRTIEEHCQQSMEKIAEVSKIIQGSHALRSALQERVDPYLALLSPVRAMPPEILQQIFVGCLPTRHNAIMHPSASPLLLGRVCSAWRTIALSTPELWSSVHVVVVPSSPEPAAVCELFRTWLQRSGNRPLSISVFIPHGTGFEENLRTFMNIILPLSPRWKSLRLLQRSWPELLCKLSSEDVPSLEVLQIADAGSDPHAIQILSIAPNLRDLSLKSYRGDALIPPRQWDRITSLCLEARENFFNLEAAQVLELIEQCANLCSCRLGFPVGAPPLPVVSTSAAHQVTLLHLHTLSLTADVITTSPFNIVNFLAALVLPALCALDLSGLSFDFSAVPLASDTLLALDELTNRSSCDIQSLRVQFSEGDPEALIRCLRRCSSLTSLDLVQPGIFDNGEPSDLTSALRELGDPALCPRLRHLRLTHCDRTDEIHPVLKALIEARCAPTLANPNGAPLRRVELNLRCESTLLTTKFAAAIHPSEVTISNPGESVVCVATLGIPEREREEQTY